VTVYNEFEHALDALKDLVREMYEGSFDEETEEETFGVALDDAPDLETVEELADGFHLGENDIKIWHLVEVGRGYHE
jgi:hypothetical protein